MGFTVDLVGWFLLFWTFVYGLGLNEDGVKEIIVVFCWIVLSNEFIKETNCFFIV